MIRGMQKKRSVFTSVKNRKEIWKCPIRLVMKPTSSADEKPVSDNHGMDFLQLIQIAGGILGVLLVAWLILRVVLKMI